MKNKFILIGVIALIAVIGLSMSACGGGGSSNPDPDPELTVDRIEVTQVPNNIVYAIDDQSLDLAGLEVTAFFSDETSEVLGANEYTVTGFIKGQSGEQTITVSYTYKNKTVTDTFIITVMSAYGGISVHFNAFHDENIVLTGGVSTLALNTNQKLTVTINIDYDEYVWYFNGDFVNSGTANNSFEITGNDSLINRIGPHSITAIVKQGEFYYSKNLTFTVVRN